MTISLCQGIIYKIGIQERLASKLLKETFPVSAKKNANTNTLRNNPIASSIYISYSLGIALPDHRSARLEQRFQPICESTVAGQIMRTNFSWRSKN
mmetsp:Transcript_28965/g.35748  ORF Transcript_28965/g.35748 Transcript_28965/m.35748 type:complete len:96 (-) Transcript_28965:1164-1451(-)